MRDNTFHNDVIYYRCIFEQLFFFKKNILHFCTCLYSKINGNIIGGLLRGKKIKINIHFKYKINILVYYYLLFRYAIVHVLIFCEYMRVYYNMQCTLQGSPVDNKPARYDSNKLLQNVLWNVGTSTTVFPYMGATAPRGWFWFWGGSLLKGALRGASFCHLYY